jgi:hypothetical protein
VANPAFDVTPRACSRASSPNAASAGRTNCARSSLCSCGTDQPLITINGRLPDGLGR